MQDRVTVAATDIARMAGVGRAAVSNWRRRFTDFPAPVAGTAGSPLFSLTEIEQWLRRQGKLAEVPLEERVWQQLRAQVEDLDLAEAVGKVGTFLASGTTDAAMPEGLAELVAERGPAATFDFLYERYLQAHSRRVTVLPAEAANLMVALAEVRNATLLDPACGLGTLLIAAADAGAAVLIGQERLDSSAAIAQARLRLHGHDGTVLPGEALREDHFGSLRADVVLCVPPFGGRDWGYDELINDARWAYGLPPRGEPELPWVQHGLFHVRPGGRVVMLMPPGAAVRRSGRRIRARLLRAGVLRAVITLTAGAAPGALGTPHLWVLQKPDGDGRAPDHVLMMDVRDLPWPQAHEQVMEHWNAFTASADVPEAVPVIDLLDEVVALTPGCRAAKHPCFGSALDAVAELLDDLRGILDDLRAVRTDGEAFPTTTLAEQIRARTVTILSAPRMHLGTGKIPALTLEDLLSHRPPTGRTTPSTDMIRLRPGDVVLPSGGRTPTVRLMDEDTAVLGPGLQVLRADPARLDPACLAGLLRAALRHTRDKTGTARWDVQKIALPAISPPAQRRLGELFRSLEAFEEILHGLTEAGTVLLDNALHGLGEGVFRLPS